MAKNLQIMFSKKMKESTKEKISKALRVHYKLAKRKIKRISPIDLLKKGAGKVFDKIKENPEYLLAPLIGKSKTSKFKLNLVAGKKTATFKKTKKGWRIVDKETNKDLTGIAFNEKWDAAQYWHETFKTRGDYTVTEIS